MEVGVVLIGSLSFPVDITAEVTFASAICKPEQENFTYEGIRVALAIMNVFHYS